MAYKQETFILHHSRGWKSRIEVLADLVSGKSSLPGSPMAIFSLWSHVAERARELVPLMKDPLSWPNHLLKVPPPKVSTYKFGRGGGDEYSDHSAPQSNESPSEFPLPGVPAQSAAPLELLTSPPPRPEVWAKEAMFEPHDSVHFSRSTGSKVDPNPNPGEWSPSPSNLGLGQQARDQLDGWRYNANA